jgi:hypothetical protein
VKFPQVAPALIANGYLRPVPIMPGKKFPGFDAWEKYTYSPADDARFASYGTGLICGEVVGLDIDCYDDQVTKSLRDLAQRMLGPTMIRVGQPPKELLIYRTTEPRAKMVTGKYALPNTVKPSRVEVLGAGQQFLVFAIHPDTGKPYTWIADESPLNTPFSAVPLVDWEQMKLFLALADEILAKAAGVIPAVSKSVTPAQAAPTPTDKWPVALGALAMKLVHIAQGDRDGWRNIAWSLKDLCGDAAFDVFHKWSETEPDYTDEAACRAVWDTDKPRQNGVTRASVLKLANDAAQKLTRRDADAKAWLDARDAHNKAQHQQQHQGAVGQLEADLVFVSDQSKYWSLSRGMYLDDHAVRHIYTPIMPGPPGQKDDPIHALMESGKKHVVNAKNYYPGKEQIFEEHGRKYLNDYIDPKVEPIEPTAEERETWEWFFNRTFGGSEDGMRFGTWFRNLLAYRVQYPAEKVYKATLIHSVTAGNGKSTWSLFLPRIILGKSNVGEPRHAMLEGQFNDYFLGKQVVHLDEIRFGGGRMDASKIMDNLKTPIDSEVLTINAKYEKPYTVRNIAWVTATSNRFDALAIDPSERRWGVFELTAPALTIAERKRLFTDWLNTDRGPGTLKYLLLAHDLSGFDPLMDPPDTESKEEMKLASEPLPLQIIREGLGGDIRTPLFDKDIVPMSAIVDFVNERVNYNVTSSSLSRLLRGSSLRMDPTLAFTDRRVRARIVRNFEYWTAASEKDRGLYMVTGKGGPDEHRAVSDGANPAHGSPAQ